MSPDDDPIDPIRRQARRMGRARSRPPYSSLQGLSAFGVIGWSVAIPTVGGALLGLWLDRVAPQSFSWPIALMLGGLVIGIIVVSNWVSRESRRARDDDSEPGIQPGKNTDYPGKKPDHD
ncbi:AtpZ/AtpI family protein [Castellaniella sp.]|uniref:AtpZ/AtpI family protein n=1 Tax=Castellaniella sp. TaxID=1955812 RepID=UPI00355D0C74